MVFPSVDRVLYRENPLEEVICQLRFPPILRIDSGNLADFQDAVRDEYPLYSEEEQISEIPIPEPLAGVMKIGQGSNSVKRFSSADNLWTVALAQNFIALTTTRYDRWEGFRTRMRSAVDALEAIYKPAFYTRVGLRYIDVIRRSQLGLGEVPWSELLAPNILSEVGSKLENAVKEVKHEAVIGLGNARGDVRVRHGLKTDGTTGEQTYYIDADLYTNQRTECNATNDQLDYFNTQAARFFRWCLTERLHKAMAPESIR